MNERCTHGATGPLSRRLSLFVLLWFAPVGDVSGQPAGQEHGGPAREAVGYRGWESIGRLQPRRSEEIGGSRWGVSCHWIADRQFLSVEKQLEQLAWLGAKWALLCPDWDRIETEKGKYNWNSPAHRFDDVIAGMVARKVAPVIQVYGGNRLYMAFEPDPNQRPLADSTKLLHDAEIREAWHRFLDALVVRYRDRVKVWEIWNEPNFSGFWKTKTAVTDYGRIVAEAAAVIRRADPQAAILAGSTAGVPLDFVEGFLASDGAGSFDYWSVHPYGELPEKQSEPIQKVQKLLRQHGKSPVLWQSECGFPSSADTGGWGFGGPWDETKHAKWVLRRLLSDAMLGMETSVCFVLNDYPCLLEGGPDRGKMGVNRKGLYAAGSWEPKQAAYAYRNLASLMDQRFEAKPVPITVEPVDAGSFGQVRSESISTYTLREKATGSPLVVYWLAVPMETKVSPGRITLRLGDQHLKDAVLVDLLNGRVYQPAGPRDPDGKPRVENLPLTDSPLVLCERAAVKAAAPAAERRPLRDGWQMQSSVLVPEGGREVSTAGYKPLQWRKASVPSTVLGVLVNNGVYPDPRIGMNSYRIPDSSDEFNAEHDLAKYSHLPNKRNPWRDPYWYRTELQFPEPTQGRHLWLDFDGINYRADVWLNGGKVADQAQMVGIYRSFRFDVTSLAKPGRNCLAVLIHPVDHPGKPDSQRVPFGAYRKHSGKEIQKDVTYVMGIGYDCMPPVPDRDMGIWQDVYLDRTGPVDIRDPFVATDLPLPEISPASLTVSADLVNVSGSPQKGKFRGVLEEGGAQFVREVELAPGETKRIILSPTEVPQLALANPRLWWPKNCGEQNLYRLRLTFEAERQISDVQTVTFGIREVSKELHQVSDHYGLRVLINGKKVFSQGGWLQPELLFDMPAHRMETEVRYLTHANLNTVTFEDVPAPNDAFLDACDRHGLMYWMSFFSSYWVTPETNWPLDHALLDQCTADLIKRYRNHPSLVLYSCVGEGVPGRDVYLAWRKTLRALDRTRLFIPTADVRFMVDWIKEDVPTGLHDDVTFGWVDPADYYRKVRAGGKWTFNTEVSIATYPPASSLTKFIPDVIHDCAGTPAPLPVDETWAHHDASRWMKDYDPAIRRLYGEPRSLADYCMKASLVSAAQHRAWSEAVNHRMWTITSGVWQWKLNSCWPSVGWQIYDWYLRPLVSAYYYRTAFEPLHVQLSPLDSAITLVNRRETAQKGLSVDITVYDSRSKLLWQKSVVAEVGANTYRDVLTLPPIAERTPVYFVDLKLHNAAGEIVSRNFYWLSSKEPDDFRSLVDLPPVQLKTFLETGRSGEENVVRVRVENPSDRIAFFIHLALIGSLEGEEILPVFWDDNYFSLVPHETRKVTARLPAKALGNKTPVLAVDGWNIQSERRHDEAGK